MILQSLAFTKCVKVLGYLGTAKVACAICAMESFAEMSCDILNDSLFVLTQDFGAFLMLAHQHYLILQSHLN